MGLLSDNLLEASGWQSAKPGEIFDQFVARLGFCLHNELLIELPDSAAGFDFRKLGAGCEFELRRLVYRLFMRLHRHERCAVIDVNHGEWYFTADELRLTTHFEPFPVSVTPWGEYVIFANEDFSQGVFGIPHNEHLVVFGKEWANQFVDMFPDCHVDAGQAASSKA